VVAIDISTVYGQDGARLAKKANASRCSTNRWSRTRSRKCSKTPSTQVACFLAVLLQAS
jgi:hypothetical protein